MQLHPTSLPSGQLGDEAYAFVDWLADAGQSWWQMLPLGPPDRYGSPYKAKSAFAAWPGLLAEPAAPVSKAEELDFREREAGWIEDWARLSSRGAVADQVRFDREWGAVRRHAEERGVIFLLALAGQSEDPPGAVPGELGQLDLEIGLRGEQFDHVRRTDCTLIAAAQAQRADWRPVQAELVGVCLESGIVMRIAIRALERQQMEERTVFHQRHVGGRGDFTASEL